MYKIFNILIRDLVLVLHISIFECSNFYLHLIQFNFYIHALWEIEAFVESQIVMNDLSLFLNLK